jgi:hypothetical protein
VPVEPGERDQQRFWLAEPVWLVVDDVHELGSDEARRRLELLILRAPPQLRFVLATRHDLRLGLHRLRLVGELTEFRADPAAHPHSLQSIHPNDVMTAHPVGGDAEGVNGPEAVASLAGPGIGCREELSWCRCSVRMGGVCSR